MDQKSAKDNKNNFDVNKTFLQNIFSNKSIQESTSKLFEITMSFSKFATKVPKIEPDVKISIPIKEKSTRKIIEEVLILPPDYSQIESSATAKETLNFLRPLVEENYMEEREFTDFLLQAFKVFNCQPKGKYFSLNLTKRQKGKMRCLIAQFRIKYGSKTIDESKAFALLLINNFELFKNDKLSSLINNMKPSKWPIEKNRIPTSQKK